MNSSVLQKRRIDKYIIPRVVTVNISFMKKSFFPEDALSTELLSFLKTAIILFLYNIKVLLFTRSVL